MRKTAKFKVGDRCKVVKNLFAPDCIGYEVTILSVSTARDGRYFYTASLNDGMKSIASEDCLELIGHEVK